MLGDSPWTSLLWMLFSVALITFLAYWFTKHVIGKRQFGGRKTGNLTVLTYLNIGRNQRLAVIRAGERYFLLGVTEQNISKITELTREEASCWEQTGQEGQNPTFREAFQEQLGKKFRGDKK